MTLRNSIPIPWRPKGLSDTLYSGTSFPGAMATLTNLVPDPTSTDLWQCRPAAVLRADPNGVSSNPFSSGFSSGFGSGTAPFLNAGFISAFKIAGTRIYGMMATDRNLGQDEPFCYDIITQSYITISGITAANTPLSPATTGTWVPPHMEVVGVSIVLTHAGFTGIGSAFFGVLNISDPNALTWAATNTSPTVLPAVPTWVAQYNGRACFFVNPGLGQPGLYMSDSLLPTVITNPTQILTFGDNVPITCGAGLPLNNQLGGIVQSLIVFKGAANLYQITGDISTMDLAVNSLNIATGTLAPNSLATTPYGLAFISPEGLRLVDFQANVSDPIGLGGLGTTVPFSYAVTPSRIAAAYAGTIYRASVQNGYALGAPKQEFWYDFARKIWHGPHTFPASLLQPYQNTFFFSPLGDTSGRIFQGSTTQASDSSFIEDGTPMAWVYGTPLFPNTDQMEESAMVETTLYLALVPAASVIVRASDEDGAIIDTVTLAASGMPTIWGAFLWGAAPWQGVSIALSPKQIAWTIPIVFQRLAIQATAASASGVAVGALNLRYEKLGYLSQELP